MVATKVQITVTKLEKSLRDGPARHQFMVYEVAYRGDGSAYQCLIDVAQTQTAGPKEKQSMIQFLNSKYMDRIVSELDLTPVIAQLF